MQIDSVPRLMRGMVGELANWRTTAPIGLVASPSRYLPQWNPLAHGRLSRRRLLLKLRNGLEIECQANEFPPFLEIFVTDAYHTVEESGIPWAEIQTIVDVGANVGMASLWFSRKASNARIVAVEPSLSAFKLLSVNVARNDLTDRVTTVRAAMSNSTGIGRLASLGATVDGRLVSDADGEEVRTITLTQLLDDHDLTQVDVLKLDCEGAEFGILESTDKTVLRRVRCIVGEYHQVEGYRSTDLKSMLDAAGFDTTLTEEVPEVGIFLAVRRD